MKEYKLLTSYGNINEEFIIESEESFTRGKRTGKRRFKAVYLIAAVLALVILAAGTVMAADHMIKAYQRKYRTPDHGWVVKANSGITKEQLGLIDPCPAEGENVLTQNDMTYYQSYREIEKILGTELLEFEPEGFGAYEIAASNLGSVCNIRRSFVPETNITSEHITYATFTVTIATFEMTDHLELETVGKDSYIYKSPESGLEIEILYEKDTCRQSQSNILKDGICYYLTLYFENGAVGEEQLIDTTTRYIENYLK